MGGCYALCLGNCGGGLSGEHYFSEVFRFFDEHKWPIAYGEQDEQIVVEVDGELVERWVLKVLIGLIASRNVVHDGAVVNEHAARDRVEVLFGLQRMQTKLRHGLYVVIQPGKRSLTERGLRFQHLFSDEQVCGGTCTIHGIRFGLLLGAYRSDDNEPLRHGVYRPAGVKLVNMNRPQCSALLRFRWLHGGSPIGLEIPVDAQWRR